MIISNYQIITSNDQHNLLMFRTATPFDGWKYYLKE